MNGCRGVSILGRIAASAIDAAYCYRLRSVVSLCVCLSLCLLVTFVSPAKTTEPIAKPFGWVTQDSAKNHIY